MKLWGILLRESPVVKSAKQFRSATALCPEHWPDPFGLVAENPEIAAIIDNVWPEAGLGIELASPDLLGSKDRVVVLMVAGIKVLDEQATGSRLVAIPAPGHPTDDALDHKVFSGSIFNGSAALVELKIESLENHDGNAFVGSLEPEDWLCVGRLLEEVVFSGLERSIHADDVPYSASHP